MPEPRRSVGPLASIRESAALELGLLLRSPTFWIVVTITALMVVGSLTVERIQIGPLREGSRTTAVAIVYVHLVWSLFFLFTATAFATDAALRDEAARFADVVRSTPAQPSLLALGRLLGSVAAVLLAFLAVPAAIGLAPFLPGASVAAADTSALGYGLLVLALPNLVLATTLFAALAALTRSAMAAYLGAVALLALYGLSTDGREGADPGVLKAVIEPFGFAAYLRATAGWSPAERASELPALAGPLLWNRLLWLTVALCCAATAVFAAARAGGSGRPERGTASGSPQAPAALPGRVRTGQAPSPSFAQLRSRVGLEFGLVVRSPFFAVVLLLGVASSVAALSPLSIPEWTFDTAAAADRLDGSFRLVPIAIAVFYAGELVWRERDSRVHELVAATPLPDWAFLAPKLLALALVLCVTMLASTVGGVVVQAVRAGPASVDLLTWFGRYLLPRTYDMALVAILAVFLQALSPGKLVGFGWMTLYFVVAVWLESAGFNGDLYRYGGHAATLSPREAGTATALLVRAYWGAVAALLVIVSLLLVGRGTEDRLRPRLARLPRRLSGFAGAGALAAALLLAGSGLLLASR